MVFVGPHRGGKSTLFSLFSDLWEPYGDDDVPQGHPSKGLECRVRTADLSESKGLATRVQQLFATRTNSTPPPLFSRD